MAAYGIAVFDLDGTVLDTLGDLNAAVNRVLAQEGLPLSTLEETRLRIGNGAVRLMKASLPEGTGDEALAGAVARFRAEYMAHVNELTKPYPGVVRMLERLKDGGVEAYVLTNKPDDAAQALCGAHFPGLLRGVTGDKEGQKKKPAPDGLLAILKESGAAKERALYIGDSGVDVMTARNAGVAMAWVSWGFRTEEEMREYGPLARFDSCEALAGEILRG